MNNVLKLNKTEYLEQIERAVKENYNSATFPNESFPREDWKKLCEHGIMLSMILPEYGGRGSHEELCEIIERTSRYNLPLGMYTMIITSVFVRNITRYGTEELKKEVLPLFSSASPIGGFALTEPHCGSNLGRMSTTYEELDSGYLISGQKHWQAFSLTADWWLVAAKNKHNEKEFAYFIIKREEGWKTIEEYHAMGLKAIDYGRSEIHALVPKYRRLNVSSKKLIGAVDMLCASRLSMSAMASGSISRMYKEAMERAKTREIGRGVLHDIGYVKYRLKLLYANKTIAKSLFIYFKKECDFRNSLLDNFFEAQAIKVLSTDKMLESALNYQQLCGGEGYRYNSPSNNAAFALLDTRVYTVFDGTNDLLSQQLAEYCLKHADNENIISFLSNFDKIKEGLKYIDITDIETLNQNNSHEEKVMNGQIISRIFGLHCLALALKSGNENALEYEAFENAIQFLVSDIRKINVEKAMISENHRAIA